MGMGFPGLGLSPRPSALVLATCACSGYSLLGIGSILHTSPIGEENRNIDSDARENPRRSLKTLQEAPCALLSRSHPISKGSVPIDSFPAQEPPQSRCLCAVCSGAELGISAEVGNVSAAVCAAPGFGLLLD